MTPNSTPTELNEAGLAAARKEADALLVQPDFADSIVRAYIAATPSGVSVKPLEWFVELDHVGVAMSPVGVWRIWNNLVLETPDPTTTKRYETADEAKAAAQADYTARILSAITPASVEPVMWVPEYVLAVIQRRKSMSVAACSEKSDITDTPLYASAVSIPAQAGEVETRRAALEEAAIVDRIVAAVRPFTRDTLFIDEHRDLVRRALNPKEPTDETRA
jgi:hypothetical protein